MPEKTLNASRAHDHRQRWCARSPVHRGVHLVHEAGVGQERAQAIIKPVEEIQRWLTSTLGINLKDVTDKIVAWDADQQKRLLALHQVLSACPPERSRSCTRTWDGSTSTGGGGKSSDASASVSP